MNETNKIQLGQYHRELIKIVEAIVKIAKAEGIAEEYKLDNAINALYCAVEDYEFALEDLELSAYIPSEG